jgi:hypothetical protein
MALRSGVMRRQLLSRPGGWQPGAAPKWVSLVRRALKHFVVACGAHYPEPSAIRPAAL